MITAYTTCCLYRALKLHFTSDYDFFQYHGKIKYTVAQFTGNSHKFVYEKLAKKYENESTITDFFIANFLENPNVWVQDLGNQESHENYIDFLRRKQSLKYIFQKDLDFIFDDIHYKNGDILKSKSGEYPELLLYTISKEINLETLVILNNFTGIVTKWDTKISDDIIWPIFRAKLLKYRPFLNYDDSDFRSIFKEYIKIIR